MFLSSFLSSFGALQLTCLYVCQNHTYTPKIGYIGMINNHTIFLPNIDKISIPKLNPKKYPPYGFQ